MAFRSIIVIVGISAALAAISGGALASDNPPGVLFYGNSDAWTTTIRAAAPLNAPQAVQLGTVIISPQPPSSVTVPAGGAFSGPVNARGFGVLPAPANGSAVAMLEFRDGTFYRALICHPVTFRFDTAGERVRYGALHGHVSVTAYSEADTAGFLSAAVFDAHGVYVDLFYVATSPHALVQAGYNGPPAGGAYTLQLFNGCAFGGACSVNTLSYAIVTDDDGALGASIDTAPYEVMH